MSEHHLVSFTAALLCMLAILHGCTSEEPYFQVKDQEIQAGYSGGPVEIAISTNQPFTPVPSSDWITILDYGNSGLTVSIDRNESEDTRRSSVVLFTGDSRTSITIIQDGHPEIRLSSETMFVPNEGETISISVGSNVEYDISVDAGWISAEGSTKALGQKTHYFTVARNEEPAERSGRIVFFDPENGISRTFTVTQQELEFMAVSQEQFEIEYDHTMLDLDLTTNLDFEVESGAGWIHRVETKGLITHQLSFTIDANPELVQRTGYVLIKNEASGQAARIVITQNPKPTIMLSVDSIYLESDSGDFSFEVTSNVQYEVSCSDNWIYERKQYQGESGDRHVISFLANGGTETRSATISVTSAEYGIVSELSIFQNGRQPALVIQQIGDTYKLPSIEGDTFGYQVDWGDGSRETYLPSLSHIYSDGIGRHTITIQAGKGITVSITDISGTEGINLSDLFQ